MLAFIITYILSFSLVFSVLRLKKFICFQIKDLKIMKTGLYFTSNKRHRLYIGQAKFLQLGRVVYLKEKRLIQIRNIDNIFFFKGWLYFDALGLVEIKTECNKFSKYFSIRVECNMLNIEKIKKDAILDLKNHIFDIKNSNFLKKYVNLIKNTLKISFKHNKIIIKQNDYKLPFSVILSRNGKKKIIKVNQK